MDSKPFLDEKEYEHFLLNFMAEIDGLIVNDSSYHNRFRKQLLLFKKKVDAFGEAQQSYIKAAEENPRLRDKKAGPPEEDWVWETTWLDGMPWRQPTPGDPAEVIMKLASACPEGFEVAEYTGPKEDSSLKEDGYWRPPHDQDRPELITWLLPYDFLLMGNRLSEEDKLLCDYTLLAVIHDFQVSPTGTQISKGICREAEEWPLLVWQNWEKWYQPYEYHYGHENRTRLGQAFNRVKADLAKECEKDKPVALKESQYGGPSKAGDTDPNGTTGKVDRLDIVNWVHGRIPFFQKQWSIFCRMVEECGEHVKKCLNNPKLKVDKKRWSELEEQGRKIRVENGKLTQKLNEAYAAKDRQLIEELEAQSREVNKRYSEVEAEIYAVRRVKPGCEPYQYCDYRFLDISEGELHSVTPEAVNPLLWFDFFGNSGIQRQPSDEEGLLVSYSLLSVLHDEEIKPSEKHIYRHDEYTGKYFQRDRFCQDLYYSLDDGQIARAYEEVRTGENAKMQQANKAKRKPVKKAIERVLDEHPELQRKTTDLTDKVNHKLKSWGYTKTTVSTVKSALTRRRKEKK